MLKKLRCLPWKFVGPCCNGFPPPYSNNYSCANVLKLLIYTLCMREDTNCTQSLLFFDGEKEASWGGGQFKSCSSSMDIYGLQVHLKTVLPSVCQWSKFSVSNIFKKQTITLGFHLILSFISWRVLMYYLSKCFACFVYVCKQEKNNNYRQYKLA